MESKSERKDRLMEGVRRAKKHVKSLGHEVCFISVYGSQNYELDVNSETYQSDADYKCVIVPTLRDLVNDSKPLSTCVEFEGGQIDIKDIRVFTDTLVKCNPAYVETLYSEFAMLSPDFEPIVDMKEELVKQMAPMFARADYGMALEKRQALCHPYPSIKDKIDKYGYDPKQLHHIYRLAFLMRTVYMGSLQFVPLGWEKEFLLKLKTEPLEGAHQAMDLADRGMSACHAWRENIEKKVGESKFEAKKAITQYARDLIYNSIKNGD